MPIEVKSEPPKDEPEVPAPTWKKLPIKIPRKVPIKTPESIAAAQAAAQVSQNELDYKHDDEPEPEPEPQFEPTYEPIDQKYEVKLPRPAPPREPFNYVQYARDYRRVHADSINRKQAINYEQNKGKILCKQVLGRLNKNQTTKPMAKTIEIYQLYQLKPGGPWRPKRVVNSRSAVRTIIYPVQAVEVRTEETPKNEILEPLPVRKRLPGDRLLKQMAKQRQKEKDKRQAQAIDEESGWASPKHNQLGSPC